MLRSIRWQVAGAFVALVFLTSAILALVLGQVSRGVYVNDLDERLRAEALLIGADLLPLLTRPLNESEVQSRVVMLGRFGGVGVTLVAPNGQVLADSEERPAVLENQAARPEIRDALATGAGRSQRFNSTTGSELLYHAVAVTGADGGPLAVVRVAVPLADVDTRIAELTRLSLLLGGGAAVVTGLVVLMLARQITRPIEELTGAVQEIAAGNLERRVHTVSTNEIGVLARAFNDMLARLTESIRRERDESATMTAVLSTMSDAVCVVNPRGSVLLLNESALALFGVARDRALGRSFIEISLDHEMSDTLERCLQTGVAQGTIIRRPQDRRILRLTATPVRPDEAQQPGALLIIQDLTELRRLESVRRDFVANVSHELRTPLAAIKAIVETLEDGALADTAAATHFLGMMHSEIDRLAQMVQELLDLSRIESGESPPVLGNEDPRLLALEVTERLRPQAERAGLDLIVEVAEGLPLVHADRERVARVFLNLLHNAIKFTASGGKITVGAEAGDREITFRIEDTGVGIRADDLPRVFERFYKADAARTGGGSPQSSSGTGLGLAIAKHTVQAHGGRIWATSRPGDGATFYFTLPMAPRPQEQSVAAGD